ncbi:uncharacterized protein BXZ73DRAFT_50396 [Epithele typhae]|uniref:uncharacterized protein n=1 Tax=Epithele typhae TaxID=378194 RepID=UPI0020084190|nr:uncharacterized protein BXZ73DRAFT_50396 [Epithele typhae]KAH9924689.1 hypothetical protein BXZ73DRAFT_50396 [Epithele typhae]
MSRFRPSTAKSAAAQVKGRVAAHDLVSTLDAALLQSHNAVELALSKLSKVIRDPSMDTYAVMEHIQDKGSRGLFDFILSASSDDVYNQMVRIILKQPVEDLSHMTSMPCELLRRLSSVSWSEGQNCDSEVENDRENARCAIAAMEAISFLLSSGTLAGEDALAQSHRGNRRARPPVHSGRGDAAATQAIIDYGEDVPVSVTQADALLKNVISGQMRLLERILPTLRSEGAKTMLWDAYLPHLPYAVPQGDTWATASTDATHVGKESQQWEVALSKGADKDIRRAEHAGSKRLKIMVNKIEELRKGHFTPDNHKMLTNSAANIPIFEAKMDRDSRLVYYIGLANSVKDQVLINVYGIYTHAQVDRIDWNAISKQLFSYYGDEKRKLSMQRDRHIEGRGDHVVYPKTFSKAEESDINTPSSPAVKSHVSSEESEQCTDDPCLSHAKFVTYSRVRRMVLTLSSNVSSTFREEQQQIMTHDSSCYVIAGRSGTGKTTVIVFKMLAMDKAWQDNAFGRRPRQLFISQSKNLVDAVKGYYDKLRLSIEVGRMSKTALKEMASNREAVDQVERLNDLDEAVERDKNQPRRYGELQESSFPLFMSFGRLCVLLENEFRYVVRTGRVEKTQIDKSKIASLRQVLGIRPGDETSRFSLLLTDRRPRLLDFETFLDLVWNHSLEASRHILSPELAFTEIMAVIKGSEDAIRSEQGFLSREAYFHRRREHSQSGMSEKQMEAVYALFEQYRRKRGLLVGDWYYDVADRARTLIRCFDLVGIPGRPLINIFVDECQDNLLADSQLLRVLCPNPHGRFWAGDTAQTISAHSAFKFSELQRLNYQRDLNSYGPKNAQHAPMFHLVVNHRSHDGIIQCAQEVVHLLIKYWRSTIDELEDERGSCPGPKPLLISAEEDSAIFRLIFKDPEGSTTVDFGARQCIIVRNDAARQRLRKLVGDVAYILTIYESKGLEFDDVLLYDFFRESTVDDSSWSWILPENGVSPDPEALAAVDHGLCRELKHLYVALTRARTTLWIVDTSSRAESFKDFFSVKGLIAVHLPESPLPPFQRSSTSAEWEEQARVFFRMKLYSEAMRGFTRAGMLRECRVAEAFLLRQQASRVNALDARSKQARDTAYRKAAHAFIKAAEDAQDDVDRHDYHHTAAFCFVDGGDSLSAAEEFEAAGSYDEAAVHFRKAGRFDHAVRVVRSQDVPEDVREGILSVARLHYIKENKTAQEVRELFDDDDEAVEYMDDYDLNTSSAAFLEQRGRYRDAAERYLLEGDILKAIDLFLLDDHGAPRAIQTVLVGLWEHLPLHAPAEAFENSVVKKLIEHAERLAGTLSADDVVSEELRMFTTIRQPDARSTLDRLSSVTTFLRTPGKEPAALRLFDYIFAQMFFPIEHAIETTGLQDAEEDWATVFRSFLEYTRMLLRLSCKPGGESSICTNPTLRTLFAFKPWHSGEEQYEVLASSSLYSSCREFVQSAEDHIVVTPWVLEDLIKDKLRTILKRRVLSQKEMAHALQSLKPCVQSMASDFSCARRSTCRNIHINIEAAAAIATYNRIVHIYILQIMIFHTLYATDISFATRTRQQRYGQSNDVGDGMRNTVKLT